MTRDSLAFALSGVFFGVLLGWIVGSQQVGPGALSVAQTTPMQETPPAAAAPAPQPLDAARVTALEGQARAEPKNAEVRVELGNMYFDAERDDQATIWYEAALKLDPKNANVSTDLGIAYFRTNQIDRALDQFAHSLTIDPKHLKTLLNQGLVRAFGKKDLAGAAESWQRVVTLAPNSEEGKKAQLGLEGIKAAHPEVGAAPPAPGGR